MHCHPFQRLSKSKPAADPFPGVLPKELWPSLHTAITDAGFKVVNQEAPPTRDALSVLTLRGFLGEIRNGGQGETAEADLSNLRSGGRAQDKEIPAPPPRTSEVYRAALMVSTAHTLSGPRPGRGSGCDDGAGIHGPSQAQGRREGSLTAGV